MTYNQIITKITDLLTSNVIIKTTRFATPTEWIGYANMPQFPVALFNINNGQINAGRDLVYSIQFWFLDKSGVEGEFEQEVISDQHQLANDIVMALRQDRTITIDSNIRWDAISEKFEDYLSGVTLTFNIFTTGQFNNCDFPI
jgi:hypothetical protein